MNDEKANFPGHFLNTFAQMIISEKEPNFLVFVFIRLPLKERKGGH